MRFIITIQIWIVTSMHIATFVYYTTDMLTIFQTASYNVKMWRKAVTSASN